MKKMGWMISTVLTSSAILISTNAMSNDHNKKQDKASKPAQHKAETEMINLDGKITKKDNRYFLTNSEKVEIKLPNNNKKIHLDEFVDKDVTTTVRAIKGKKPVSIVELIEVKAADNPAEKTK